MNGKKIIISIFAFVLVLVLGACNQTGEETEGAEETEETEETEGTQGTEEAEETEGTEETEESSQVTYESHVEGIIEQSCISCHGEGAPSLTEFKEDPDTYIAKSQGPRLDNYEDLVVLVNGDDAGALMRRLDDGSNTDDGEPGNMYINLGSTEEERQQELAIIKEWVGSWSLKRSDELTDEERAEITAVRE